MEGNGDISLRSMPLFVQAEDPIEVLLQPTLWHLGHDSQEKKLVEKLVEKFVEIY